MNAPDTFSFPDVLDSRRAIVDWDLGSPPAGAELLQHHWASYGVREFGRAILTRRITDESSPVVMLGEEFPVALDRGQADIFNRVTSLSRFKRCAIWLSCQSAVQVQQVSPALPKILHTNAGIEAWFRSPIEDARALGHALPVLDPGDPTGGRSAMIEQITRLPRRHALLWIKSHRAVFIRSPRIDFDAIQKRAALAPPEVHAAIHQGIASARREVLEDHYAASARAAQLVKPPKPPRQPASDDDSPYPRLG